MLSADELELLAAIQETGSLSRAAARLGRAASTVPHAARQMEERFDALLVCNGHHWDPRWPEPMFPGHDTFAGTQMHAHDYRDSDVFAGKRALILGMGNSAMDIAVEASWVAQRTYLAARTPVHVVPKYVLGRPLDQLETPALARALPWKVRQRITGCSRPSSAPTSGTDCARRPTDCCRRTSPSARPS